MTRGFRAVRLSLLLVPLVLWSTPGAAQPAGTMTWGVHVTLATRWLDPAETESEITPFMILYALQPDAVAGMPEGMVVANGAITYRRAKTLIGQLAELGIEPADVTYVAVSHTHGDHVGNVALFPTSTVLIQAAEFEWAMAGPAKPAFQPASLVIVWPGWNAGFAGPAISRFWCALPRRVPSCSRAMPSTSRTTG